jgi:hypothetical protein
VLAVLGLGFFLIRVAGNSWSLMIAADDQRAKLEALKHVPMGARVASLVGDNCSRPWPLARNTHLGAMVIVRRHGFSNDQWVTSGLNLLRLRYRAPGAFASDPSQIVPDRACPPRWSIDLALRRLPRDKFDYLWLMDTEPFAPELVEGMKPVWRGPDSTLYRINPRG